MKYSSVRGTRDILEEEAAKLHFWENVGRKVFSNYCYREICIPTFEQTELFNRSIGETSDIVEKEMYTFEDKKRRSITLRPEGTAGLARAYIEHNLYKKNSSSRLYYVGSMFRYERPQAGRYREFRQMGIEFLGSDNPGSDVEVINVFVDFLKRVELKDFYVSLNNVGCKNCGKKYKEIFKDSMKKNLSHLCSDCQRRFFSNPLRVLDCKKEDCRTYLKNIPFISDYLCKNCKEKFAKIKEYLTEVKIE